MRILFLAHCFPKPDNSVMATWALTQAEALLRQGVELKVVSFTAWVPPQLALTPGAKAYAHCPSTYTWLDSVETHYPRWLYYPVSPLKQPAYVNPAPFLQMAYQSAKHKLMRLVETYQPDLFFCHHSLPNGWIISQLPPQYQRPLIVLDHDFDEIADCSRYRLRQQAMQTVANRAWAMLAVANRMADNMRYLFPQAHVLTHHNGVDAIASAVLKQPRPDHLQNRTVVLSCALFAERKGVPLLIKAFSRIAAQHPEAILRIIGSGPDEAKIRQTVASLNLTERVQLVGRKTHAEVLQEMAWADCFALVGWDEPFATVYLEAMAAGKPIICCNDGGINDVIQHGVQGYTVPPKDVTATANALDQMLSNQFKRQEMGRNAQNLILEKLTWDAKAKQLIKLFEQAVDQPQSIVAV
jgi:glycosyltransferase involved in cell wall biosynthesis